MDHSEAIELMAAERYLLDELTPELRESFEEHAFDCTECSLDLRAGAAFIQVAKTELPGIVEESSARIKAEAKPARKKFDWSLWLRPAFAVPAFAGMLGVIGFQNLATIPALKSAAREPRILPSVSFHAGTRGAPHTQVLADRNHGVVFSIELPQGAAYASYGFDLYDPSGKQQWSRTISTSVAGSTGDGTVSLVIPGAGLQQGSYTLAISGVTAEGGRTEIERRVLDIQFAE
jgi:hypothetical protein